MTKKYQMCVRCVMDTTDPDIEFDEHGLCNHCRMYDREIKASAKTIEVKQQELHKLVAKIKEEGKGKPYDCVSGVSGGIDSTYATYLMKELGLRVLIVHVDNGWNSELAVQNINQLIKSCGFDLYTKVIDWPEFKKMQRAYFKASVIDIEALSDHAIIATLYKVASKYNVNYILAGTNKETEFILPDKWRYDQKGDASNIVDISKRFEHIKPKKFPLMSFWEFAYYHSFKKIQWVSFLDYYSYNKTQAIETMSKTIGWRDYGGKHYESLITKFYQGYILPVKFGVDKRKAHLSTLINSGQLSREEALAIINKPALSTEEVKELKEYFIKKIELTEKEFDEIMSRPVKSHHDYKTDKKVRDFLFKLNRIIRKS